MTTIKSPVSSKFLMIDAVRRIAIGRTLPALLATALLAACASSQIHPDDEKLYTDARDPGFLLPASPDETELLAKIDTLTVGQTLKLSQLSATIAADYHAASGRHCRLIALQHAGAQAQQSQKLACHTADGWQFFPDVFPASASLRAE